MELGSERRNISILDGWRRLDIEANRFWNIVQWNDTQAQGVLTNTCKTRRVVSVALNVADDPGHANDLGRVASASSR